MKRHLLNGFLSIVYCSLFSLAVSSAFAQTPIITSFSPESGPVSTTVTIVGQNFNTILSNNQVFFGATQAPVQSIIGSTTLTVTVPYGADYRYISVTDLSTGLISYSARPFVVTYSPLGNNMFRAPVRLTSGSSQFTSYVTTADVNKDGKPDLIVANIDNSGSVFPNQITSTTAPANFGPPVSLSGGFGDPLFGSVNVGDVDGDGWLDIVMAFTGVNQVVVFRNTTSVVGATPSFDAAVTFPTIVPPNVVSMGDLDQDGKVDLILGSSGYSNPNISVLRNQSSIGTINFASFQTFSAIINPSTVVIGDLDQDGKPDVAVGISGGSNEILVFRNTSTVNNIDLSSPITLTVGADPTVMAIGDFDGDTKLDLATANSSNNISIFLNTSTGGTISFANKVDFSTGTNSGPRSLAISDLNGDGKVDIGVGNVDNNTLVILQNNSNISTLAFTTSADVSNGEVNLPSGIAIVDLNADSHPDIITTVDGPSDNLAVFLYANAEQASQTLTITSPNSLVVDETLTVTITTTATSGGGTLSYNIFNGSGSAMVDSEGLLTAISAGEVTLTVTASGDTDYSATSTSQLITISPGTPTLSFSSSNTLFIGDSLTASVNTSATYARGGDISFSIAAGSGSATIDSITGYLTTLAAGTVTLTAISTGDVDYNPATASQLITIQKTTPTLTISSSNTLLLGYMLTATVTTTATISSGGVLSFVISPGSGSATVNPNTGLITALGTGTVTLNVVSIGDTNYYGVTTSQEIMIGAGTPTFTITSANAMVVDQTIMVTISTTQDIGTLTYDILNGSGSAYVDPSGMMAAISVGDITLTVSSSGNANYNPSSATQHIIIGKTTPTLTITSANTVALGASLQAVTNTTATYDRGGAVTFAVSAGSGSATVNANTGLITPLFTGTVTLTVMSAGDADYNSASVSQEITIGGSIPIYAQKAYYPGGLTNTNISLWLNASVSSSIITSGSSVISWNDLSSNGHSAVQNITDFQPAYSATGSSTGKPEISFTRSSGQYLQIGSLNANFAPGVLSVFSVARFTTVPGVWERIFDFGNGPEDNNILLSRNGANSNYVFSIYNGNTVGNRSSNGDLATNTAIYDFVTNSSTPYFYLNGSTDIGSTGFMQTAQSVVRTSNYIGKSNWQDDYLEGGVSELLFFNTDLNTTQRILVENYQAAQWGLMSSLASSKYSTTTSYGASLVGIGRTTSDDYVSNTQTNDGFGLSSSIGSGDFLQTDGNYLLAAHNGQLTSTLTVAGSATPTHIWNRNWFLNKTDVNSIGGNVTVYFDFDTYNGTLPPSGVPFNLLYTSDGDFASGNYVTMPVSNTLVNESQVQFTLNANSLLNGYYTISAGIPTPISQTLTITSSNMMVVDGTLTATITTTATNGGGTLNYSIFKGSGLASVDSEGLITAISAGDITLTVSSSGNANYNPASATQHIIIGKTTPTLSITSVNTVPIGFSLQAITTTTATYDRGGVVTFSVSAGSGSATVDTNTGLVNTLNLGSITLTAISAGDADYYSASVSQEITIGKSTPSLTITSSNSLNVGESLSATVVSTAPEGHGGAYSYSIEAGSGSASVDSTTGYITAVSVGTVILNVVSAGDADYNAASTSQAISIGGGIPTIISSFSPQSGPVSTAVTITGQNFSTIASNNVVFFGAVQGTVTGASSTSLTVIVPYGANYQYFSVTNLEYNTIAYSSRPFVVTFPTNEIVDFISDSELSTPASPYGLTLGDFNGDGKPDLVVASNGQSRVSVYRNISTSGGSLSFTLGIDLSIVGGRSVGSTLADFDGDGKLDLAVSEHKTSIVEVFRNTTAVGSDNFTFSTGMSLPTAGGSYWLGSGDLDGDGRIDIVSSNVDTGTNNVISIFRNVSTSGTLNFISKQDIAVGQDPIDIAIGDLDQDNKPEIAVSNKASNTISILGNRSAIGDISFTEEVILTGLNLPHGIAMADLDGDTNLDLVVANWGGGGGNTVSFFLNTNTVSGTLSFNTTADLTFVTGTGPIMLSASDVDGDGKVDIAVESINSSTLSVLKNSSTLGSFSFTNGANYSISGGSENVVLGDMNGDSKPDIAVSGSTIFLFRNNTTLVSAPVITSFSPQSGPVSITVSITGQNFSTIASNNVVFFGAVQGTVTGASSTSLTAIVPYGANYQYISVTNLEYNTTAYSAQPFVLTYPTPVGGFNDFAPELAFSITSQPLAHAVADFDGDNKPDIIVGSNGEGVVTLMLNRTIPGSSSISYTLTTFTIPSVYNAVVGIAAADYDGDGKLDLAMSDSVAPEMVYLYRNISTIGTLSFTANTTIALSSGTGNSFGVTAGDLDNDGRPDLAFVTDDTAQIAVCRNLSVSGSIMFSTQTNFAIPSGSYTVAMGDIDGDGKLDMLAALASTANVAVLRNTSSGVGDISFASTLNLTNGSNTSYSVALGDFNGDNKLDIVAGNFNDSSISVYRNLSTSGALSFTIAQTFATGSDRRGVSVGDVDGDSRPDVVSFGNGASGYNISVLKNATTSSTNINFASAMDYKSAYVNTINGSQPGRVSLVDLNLDGLLEIVTTNPNPGNSVSIYRNIQVNPVVVSSFTPASGPISTTVTIAGQNFSTTALNNVVFFGATQASVTGASSTSLTVTVPYGANYQYISVTNLDYNTTGYSLTPFVVTFPSNGITDFGKGADLTGSSNPYGMALGDLNGDGKPDLIVANDAANASVYRNVSTSSGSLSFVLAATLSSGTKLREVTVTDFDGDGRLDFAMSDYTGKAVLVFRNITTLNSSIFSFVGPQTMPITGSPYGLTSGDLDGDGRADIVISNVDSGPAGISIFQNLSVSGTFSFASRQDIVTTSDAIYIAIGDLDRDTKPDVVVAHRAPGVISILRNISSPGTISLTLASTLSMGGSGHSVHHVSISDFDGDGNPDIVGLDFDNSLVSFFRNTNTIVGVISFPTTASLTVTSLSGPVFGLSLADFDGDGKVDVAVANRLSNQLSVFKNNSVSGSLSFTNRLYYSITGSGPDNVIAGDMNGDGKPDIAISGGAYISLFSNLATNVQPPVITSFSPINGPISTSVTIAGSNFNTTANQNVVFFGATQATVTGASSTSLTVTVPYGANYQYITVTNLDYNTTAYSTQPFVVIFSSDGIKDFVKKDLSTLSNNPRGISLGDLNGDGKPDLVVGNTNGAGVNIYRNVSTTSGSLSFVLASIVAIGGGSPYGIVLADFDGDGKIDFAAEEYDARAVQVFRNTTVVGSSSITFSAGPSLNTVDYGHYVAAGDFDGDGRPDIISGDVLSGGANTVRIFRNQSVSGTLSFGATQILPVGAGTFGIAVGDVDRDGKPDVIVVNNTDNSVSILRNISTMGTINLSPVVTLTGFSSPREAVVGDFDQDGRADLAVSNFNTNEVWLYLNTTSAPGVISFPSSASVKLAVGTNPWGLSIGDTDGDSKVDLAVINNVDTGSSVSVFKNMSVSGSLSFTNRIAYSTGNYSENIVVGDMNSDGRPDIAVTNLNSNTISFYQNILLKPVVITSFTPTNGPVSTSVTITGSNFNTIASNNIVFFGATQAIVTGATSASLTAIVPYGANYQYISITNLEQRSTGYSTSPFISTYSPIGANTFESATTFSTGANSSYVVISDFNRDGKPDLAVANDNGTLLLFQNQTSASATTPVFITAVTLTTTATGGTTALAVGDFDSDGWPDLAYVNDLAGAQLSIFRNTTFGATNIAFATQALTFTTGNAPNALAVGDVDNDGKPDLVVTDGAGGSNDVWILRNLSSSDTISFLNVTTIAANGPNGAAFADLDQDGKVDLIVSNSSANQVRVFKNISAGSITFDSSVNLSTSSSPRAVAIGDFNGDGFLDIASANSSGATISIFRNSGVTNTIAFAAGNTVAVNSQPNSLAIEDTNGDGKPDILVPSLTSNQIALLNNTSTVGAISFVSTPDVTNGSVSTSYIIASGDLNADSKPDFVVTTGSSNIAIILQASVSVQTLTITSASNTLVDSSLSITVARSVSETVGGALTYSITAGSGSATIDGAGNLRAVGAGTVTLTVTALGNSNYTAASVNQLIIIGKATPTLSITSANTLSVDASLTATVTTTATGGRGGIITFTVLAGSGSATVDVNTGLITAISSGTLTLTASAAGDINYTAASTSQLIAIQQSTQALTITSDNIMVVDGTLTATTIRTTPDGMGGAVVFSITAGSGSATVDINTGFITAISVGTVTLTANAVGDTNYSSASTQQLITIDQAEQILTITSADTIPLNGTLTATVVTTATHGRGGKPIFLYTAGSGSAIVDSDTGLITAISAGTITLTVFTEGDTDYLRAATSQLITILQATQTLTITSANTMVVGEALTASVSRTTPDGRGGAVTFSVVDGSGSVTVDTSTGYLVATGVGTVTLIASAAGDTDYTPALTSQIITIGQNTPTLTITSASTMTVDTALTVTVNSTAIGESVLYYSVMNGSGAALVSPSGVITPIQAGTITLTVTAEGNSNYYPISVNQLITIIPGIPVLTITSPDVMIVDGSMTASVSTTATYDRGGAITFSISAGSGSATVDEITGFIYAIRAGTVTLTATSAGDADYSSGTTSQLITIVKSSQTLTLTAASTMHTGDTQTATVTTTAMGGRGGTITFSVVGGSGSATVEGATGFVTAIGAGTFTLMATSSGDADYEGATTSLEITVGQGAQTLTITSANTMVVDQALTATVSRTTISGGGAIIFSIMAGSGSATVDSDTGLITAISVGTVTLTATTGGDINYFGATTSQEITIGQGAQTLTITSSNMLSLGNPLTATVITTATGGRGGVVTFSITAGSGSATVDTNTGLIIPISAGMVTLSASISGDTDYTSATTTQLLFIDKSTPTLIITSANTMVVDGTLTATVSTTAGDGFGGAFTYSIVNGTGSAIINPTTGLISAISVGTITLTVVSAGDSGYYPATASQLITIAKASQTLTIISPNTTIVDSNMAVSVTTTATLGRGGSFTYNITNGTGIATVDASGVITAVQAGTVTLTVNSTGDADYNGASATQLITIGKNTPTLTITSDSVILLNTSITATVNTTATLGRGGAISYSIDAGSGSASVDPSTGLITALQLGTVTLTVSSTGDESYNPATTSQSIVITIVNISSSTNSLAEGETGVFTLSLAPSLVLSSPITFTIVPSSSNRASENHYSISSTVVFPIGQNSLDIPVKALPDKILYNDELLVLNIIHPTFGMLTGTLTITDATALEPSNLVVTIQNATIYQSQTVSVTVSLPDGVTSLRPIDILLNLNTLRSELHLTQPPVFPLSVTIGANSNSVTFDLSATAADDRVSTIVIGGTVINASSGTLTYVVNEGEITVFGQKLEITRAFSPNGDGVGDNYVISNITSYPDNEVFIMDLNLDIVYHGVGYNNDSVSFTGEFQGLPLPTGIYFYRVLFYDKARPYEYKGFFKLRTD